jgi:hypothetical protein
MLSLVLSTRDGCRVVEVGAPFWVVKLLALGFARWASSCFSMTQNSMPN